MTDRTLPDLTLLPVATAVAWETQPFLLRAEAVMAFLKLPEWKLPEMRQNMERIFAMAVADGKTPKQALDHLDASLRDLFPGFSGEPSTQQ